MMTKPLSKRARRRIQREAVFWDWRLKDPTLPEEEFARFRTWHANPAHQEMLEAVDMVRARQRRAVAMRPAARHPADLRRRLITVAAASLLVLFWYFKQPERTLQTQDMPQGRVLDDGSTVRLAANTQLEIQFSTHARSVHLLQGEAFFQVVPDASRPFFVKTSTANVQAVGTRFVVSYRDGESKVTVLEGSVAVTAAPAHDNPRSSQAGSTRHLHPSEQWRILKDSTQVMLRPTEVLTLTAWATAVSFSDRPILQAVEEFNIRSGVRIELTQPELIGPQRLSGIFQLDDPVALAGYLARRTANPVKVHHSASRVQTILPEVTSASE